MATPIITTTQTVLAWAVGQDFYFQLTASGLPTNWRLEPGFFLPNGVTFGPSNGLISGSATVAGVWDLKFIASNADGDSAPVLITLGIFDLPQRKDVSKVVEIDTETWGVSFSDPFVASTSPVLSAAAGGVRYEDVVTFDLRFTEPSVATPGVLATKVHVFPKLRLARFSIKGTDSDPVFFVTDEWDFNSTIVYDGAYKKRYFVNVYFSNDSLLAFLNDYETETGTVANCICEFEFIFDRNPAAGVGLINRITTQAFLLRLQRDTVK